VTDRIDLKTLAAEIAKHLGESWKVDEPKKWSAGSDTSSYEPPHWVYLQGEGYERLHLRYTDEGERISVSGWYPTSERGEVIDRLYPTVGPSIAICDAEPCAKIAVSRGAATIAKEINRRFLPKYREILALVVERKAYLDKYEAAQANSFERLATAFGTRRITEQERKNHKFSLSHLISGLDMYGDASVSNVTAELHLRSVPIDLAVKIAETILNYKKEK
jgi:hypothetical protein